MYARFKALIEADSLPPQKKMPKINSRRILFDMSGPKMTLCLLYQIWA